MYFVIAGELFGDRIVTTHSDLQEALDYINENRYGDTEFSLFQATPIPIALQKVIRYEMQYAVMNEV